MQKKREREKTRQQRRTPHDKRPHTPFQLKIQWFVYYNIAYNIQKQIHIERVDPNARNRQTQIVTSVYRHREKSLQKNIQIMFLNESILKMLTQRLRTRYCVYVHTRVLSMLINSR